MTVPLAAAAVVGPGGPPLGPWLDFHRRVGIGRFHLYRTGTVAIPAASDVTVADWPAEQPHRSAWIDCLSRHGPDCEWLALLEPDEYLFATDGTPLPAALADFADRPAVGVARLLYAPAEAPAVEPWRAVRRARASLVMALPAFLRAPGLDPAEYENHHPLAARVAWIVRPAQTAAATGRHAFRFRAARPPVDESGRPLSGGWADPPTFRRLRVNQYLQSEGETLRTRFADLPATRRAAAAQELALFRTEIDTAILPIAHDCVMQARGLV